MDSLVILWLDQGTENDIFLSNIREEGRFMFMDFINIFIGIFYEAWGIFEEASFYILLGLFVSGLIHSFISKEKIGKYLGYDKKIGSVFYAALFGIPLPLCSCGVLPTAISLRRQGASKGATVSFLISTPESGVDSIAITYALIDTLMTIFRPISAFITAISAGIIENLFPDRTRGKEVEENKDACMFCDEEAPSQNHNHSLLQRASKGLQYAFVELLGDIAKWLLIGIGIAGVISYLVPEGIIEDYLGYGWQPMILMLIVGIPIYICASASTPIAAVLISKGMSPGVALVFLLAGPATNIASLIVVGKFLGKRTAVVYLTSICISAIILGVILNQIYLALNIDIGSTVGRAGEVIPNLLKTVSAILLLLLMAKSMYHESKNH